MKGFEKIAGLVIVMGLMVSSCLKPQSFPNEPIIEYVSFEAQGDSGVLTFSFTDGDGDVGLNTAQISAPYDTGSYFYYNVYVDYYEMMDGEWVHGTADPLGQNFPTADSVRFPFRIENLTPIGQNKALKGEIELTLEPFYYNTNPLATHSDSIRYEIVLIDRALNVSNTLVTPTILTP